MLLVLEQRLRRGALLKVRFRSQREVTAAARTRRLERSVQRWLLRRAGHLLALMAFAVEQFRHLPLLSLSVYLACHALDAASRRGGLRLEHDWRRRSCCLGPVRTVEVLARHWLGGGTPADDTGLIGTRGQSTGRQGLEGG